MDKIHGVLFDLDGTLLDTAPDLAYAINLLRKEHNQPEIPLKKLRPIMSYGSKFMIKELIGVAESDPTFSLLREKFLSLYDKHLADSTCFFPQMDKVLLYLEEQQIPWGIVTNKLSRHTLELLKVLRLDHRPACIVCGDSLPVYKPDPEPIRYACQLIKREPANCIYVGDSATDVIASKAAGIRSIVALYGYIPTEEDPLSWGADAYINNPLEIIQWLERANTVIF